MAGNRLRPHAERAQRRAPARRIERNVRVQKERHVVALNLQIALVNIGRKRQRVQLLGVQLRTRRVVDDFAFLAITDAHDLLNGLPVRVFHHGVVKLAVCHEIDVFACQQCFIRLDVPVRADKRDLQAGIRFLDLADELDVAAEADRRGEQNQKLVVFANLNRLLPIHLMRRRVQQAASRNHSSGIRQPHRVPIGLNLTRRGPPRARPAIEILKTWRVQ